MLFHYVGTLSGRILVPCEVELGQMAPMRHHRLTKIWSWAGAGPPFTSFLDGSSKMVADMHLNTCTVPEQISPTETVFCTGKYSLYFYTVNIGLWGFVPGRGKGSSHLERWRISAVIIEMLLLMC